MASTSSSVPRRFPWGRTPVRCSGGSRRRGRAILANVRSEEPDVSGIVGKLTQGAADAGFVYATDVQAAGSKLKTIELPKALRPNVKFGVAVVKGAKEPEAAQAFINGLLEGEGREAMESAGFLPPG